MAGEYERAWSEVQWQLWQRARQGAEFSWLAPAVERVSLREVLERGRREGARPGPPPPPPPPEPAPQPPPPPRAEPVPERPEVEERVVGGESVGVVVEVPAGAGVIGWTPGVAGMLVVRRVAVWAQGGRGEFDVRAYPSRAAELEGVVGEWARLVGGIPVARVQLGDGGVQRGPRVEAFAPPVVWQPWLRLPGGTWYFALGASSDQGGVVACGVDVDRVVAAPRAVAPPAPPGAPAPWPRLPEARVRIPRRPGVPIRFPVQPLERAEKEGDAWEPTWMALVGELGLWEGGGSGGGEDEARRRRVAEELTAGFAPLIV
ncbi:hypothetical protein HRbin32_01300 [bacterium HR32]|nr:hypothetical protein HRbin32_01300 [bacterium HR32]